MRVSDGFWASMVCALCNVPALSQVGLGNCAKEVFVKPVERVEGSLRFAWESTAEVIGAIGETMANDLQHVSFLLVTLPGLFLPLCMSIMKDWFCR